MDIEVVKVLLQALTLVAIVAGLAFTGRQLKLLKDSFYDTHDWNRRKAAQDAVHETQQRLANDMNLLQEAFQTRTSSSQLSLNEIEEAFAANEQVRVALHKRLNNFETLAIGIEQKVLDEQVIKDAYRVMFRRTRRRLKEYIDARKERNEDAWKVLERVSQRWEEQEATSSRLPTGGDRKA